MTKLPGTKIAIAQVQDILYDDFDSDQVMHIGCGYPGTNTHIAACGYHDPKGFDPSSIDDTPEEYVCLACIVTLQDADSDWCWKTGQVCLCRIAIDIET